VLLGFIEGADDGGLEQNRLQNRDLSTSLWPRSITFCPTVICPIRMEGPIWNQV